MPRLEKVSHRYKISAILHLIIKPFSKRLDNAKITGLPQALVGAAFIGVISADFHFAVSKPHSTVKGQQIVGLRIRSNRSCSPVRTEGRMSLALVQGSNKTAFFIFFIICCGDSYREPSRTSVGEPQWSLLHGHCSCFLPMLADGHVRD